MAALRVFLPLAICLLLGHQTFAQTFAYNNAPCQPSKRNNAFNTFVKRHIIPNPLPTTDDQNKWEKHIKKDDDRKRTTQSFLRSEELEGVKAVCTKAGGKTYKGNLCISKKIFTFVTVTIEKGPCTIKDVTVEKKHLILACDKLKNQCLPVHFEKNDENEEPKNYPKNCQAP